MDCIKIGMVGVVIGLGSSCQHAAPPKPSSTPSKEVFQLDTFPERNNPATLDLSQHQLFIDTTRNSIFYKSLEDWQPHPYDERGVKAYLEFLTKKHEPQKVEWKNFPTAFVQIHQQGGEFILYDRCDGIDPRYELKDSSVLFYGPLESEVALIKELLSYEEKGIKLELYVPRKTVEVAMLEIRATNWENIYQLHYQDTYFNRQQYIIPVAAISDFDLMVNHCPTRKVVEHAPFYK